MHVAALDRHAHEDRSFVNRYIALLWDATPLGGVCPACEHVMDESGCRIGDHFISKDTALTEGIAQIVEIFCAAPPTAVVVVECPACPA
jgi:hypothetical protein